MIFYICHINVKQATNYFEICHTDSVKTVLPTFEQCIKYKYSKTFFSVFGANKFPSIT
ncbi:hypothetical protein BH10ACI2_BH10ACI2_24020 [soil metagenome]